MAQQVAVGVAVGSRLVVRGLSALGANQGR
jgi:hypothetical protein